MNRIALASSNFWHFSVGILSGSPFARRSIRRFIYAVRTWRTKQRDCQASRSEIFVYVRPVMGNCLGTGNCLRRPHADAGTLKSGDDATQTNKEQTKVNKLKETGVVQPSSSPPKDIPVPEAPPLAEVRHEAPPTPSAPAPAPAEETPTQEIPTEEISKQELPTQEIPKQVIQAQEIPAEEFPAEAAAGPVYEPESVVAKESPKVISAAAALQQTELAAETADQVPVHGLDRSPEERSSAAGYTAHSTHSDIQSHGSGAGNVSKSFRDGVSFHVDKNGVVEAEDEEQNSILGRHNVRIVGEGEKLLVMAHGFGTNQQIWGGVIDKFDLTVYKIVLFDLMGAYSTDPEDFDFQRYSTLHGYADDLLEVLEALGVQSCTYIGASVSGMIGIIASIERPEIFERLIAIGASPRYLNDDEYHGGFTVDALDQVFAAMQDNYKAWVSGFAPMVVGEDVESASVREFSRSLFLIRPDIAFSTLKTIFMCDLRHLLPQVTVQSHLLQTARDAAVPWEVCQYLLDHIPNAFAEVIPVEGHLPHLTHPVIIGDALLSHLAMPIRPTGLLPRRVGGQGSGSGGGESEEFANGVPFG